MSMTALKAFFRFIRTNLAAILLCLMVAVPTSLALTLDGVPGWNLLGAGLNAPLNVATTFGNAGSVTSVWKWVPSTGKWAFYSPQQPDGGAAYAASMGYEFLTTINPGEGFWLNASTPFSAAFPDAAPITSSMFQTQFDGSSVLSPGWNLISIGDNKTPSAFNRSLGFAPPAAGEIPFNLNSLWAWDAEQANWYFYAPTLEKSGGLASFIQNRGYLNFGAKLLGQTTGFWVNANAPTVHTISYMLGVGKTGNGGGNVATSPSASVYPSGAEVNLTATANAGSIFSGWSGACSGTVSICTVIMNASKWVTATFTLGGGGGSPAPAPVPVPPGPSPVNAAALSPAAFAALQPVVAVGGVAIGSPPRLTFSVADASGNGIFGMFSTSRSAIATVASYPNLAFALAKYVPGTPLIGTTTRTPGKWVSYIVTTVPTNTTAATAARPTTDSTGTLVDNLNGTYTYTFYRDITKVKDQVAAMVLTPPNVAADLGDLTYDPNALHRLTIQIAGNAPGTGTNTADGIQVTTGVPMTNPNNFVYDFIPATGAVVAPTDTTVSQRLIVDKLSCNECHGKLGGIPGTDSAGFHGGSRYDPKYCVVCHTDQRKYGQAQVWSTNNAFPPLTKTVSGTSVSYTPVTYVADGVTVGDFPVLIHRVHKGEELVKKNYNYANVLLNETRFPQDIRNCTKCHDTTAPKIAPQGNNWKLVPSRLACGACHDGIDWATGTGTTNAGLTTGHIGGAKSNDTQCALCHDATSIPIYHIPVTPPNPLNALIVPIGNGGNNNTAAAWIASNVNTLPAGAVKVSYDISSVSRNASKNPVIVFRMLQNGARTDFNTFVPPATSSQEIWNNFMGSPSVYFVWSVPQDGISAPADFNASASGYIRSIWNGMATGAGAGTLSAPDASGYYTITLTGVQVPDSAVMLTGGVGYTYGVTSTLPLTQTNLARYPVAPATASAGLVANMPNKTGGLIVIAQDAQRVAFGYTGRRPIVEDARCNKCHQELGVFTAQSFHAGQRNDGTTCSWCHNPNRTSSGWSADSSSYIHAIHAASKREKPFTWHASSTTSSFANLGYPGILKNCETCHLPGTYDFSASASAAALPNRQYRTVGMGKYDGTVVGSLTAFSIAPYVTADNVKNYGAGFAFNASATTASNITRADGTIYSNPAQGIFNAESSTLVISPITTVCFSCHDSALAATHMESNGGSIYKTRGAPDNALAKAEQCALCHLAGKIADIKLMHNR